MPVRAASAAIFRAYQVLNGVLFHARLPNQTPITELNRAVADAIDAVGAADIFGNLVIIEPGRIRLSRKGL